MRLSKVYRPEAEQAMERLELLAFDAPGGRAGYRSSNAFVGGTMTTGAPLSAKAQARPAEPVRPAPTEQELTAIREQAKREGLEAGRREGRQQLDKSANALAQALTEVSKLREAILQNSSHDMLRLVMTISEQVLQREFRHDPQAILPVIERALQAALRSDSVRLRVHPEDLAAVTDHKPLFLAGLAGLKNLVIEADPAVSRGGCLVESELGEVDARLETQLTEIRRALDELLGEG